MFLWSACEEKREGRDSASFGGHFGQPHCSQTAYSRGLVAYMSYTVYIYMRVQYTVTCLLVYVELMDQYQYCLNDIHTAAFIRKLRFLYGLKSPCEGVYILYHAANSLLFLRVVGPGAYKPSDGEGIESRRPLFLSFSLSFYFYSYIGV